MVYSSRPPPFYIVKGQFLFYKQQGRHQHDAAVVVYGGAYLGGAYLGAAQLLYNR